MPRGCGPDDPPEPTVDGRQPGADQRHARDLPGQQGFGQTQGARQDGADRDQKGHQPQIGRPRRDEEAETEHIGQRGRHRRQPDPPVAGHPFPAQAQDGQQDRRRQCHAAQDHGQDRDVTQGMAVEKERPAPQDREGQQQGPFLKVHQALMRSRHGPSVVSAGIGRCRT